MDVDIRKEALADWARSIDLDAMLPDFRVAIPRQATLSPVSDDASFRRYFRFSEGAGGLVFVDAPPAHEDSESFIRISRALNAAGLACPRVISADLEQGFMAITDLGDQLYFAAIRQDVAQVALLYEDAVTAILRMIPIECGLPQYDAARLRDEMALFHEWFLPKQLGMTVSADIKTLLNQVYDFLIDSALSQPTGFVHRDFHCRNLMKISTNNPGIIDFQDAVTGPVTYDLVSLFKDCYYRFDRKVVVSQVNRFAQRLQDNGVIDLPAQVRESQVIRWFDLMGAQRHLKCAGIFSRLNLRDGKPRYLGDIPLVIDYLVETAGLYEELNNFGQWLASDVVPLLDEKLAPEREL